MRYGIASEQSGGVLVLEVCGEPGITTVLRWATVLETAVCELPCPRRLVIDLGRLDFLSERGARGLLEAFGHCRARGLPGCLVAPPGTGVDRVVRHAGLGDHVPVFPDRLATVAAYQPVEVRWLAC
ncbi:anti-sigma factor antagonist [Amycolatopsis balhimycina DSM 5908]|uniref:Anti-sigma factor antagonist n=1 Tax=Amycolatopsis balhimycina DSM 5908 TaxID=1081091 RepID=A0A428WC70_AMYBA|nr:STAS domain-containing protein [Amycolatopsis balhimycina]RSM40692.1 anti-sigma factor antagonist [Amycolatopsis balhimycina DSM 5908]